MPLLTGGCHCGRVRYDVRGAPFLATLCHCTDCRRVAGAPAVAWFTVRPEDFVVTRGEPRSFQSSAGVTRSFCADCGTPLTYGRDDLPDEIDVTTASLDDPSRVPPRDETYVRDRLGWVKGTGALPSFPGARPDELSSC